MQNDCKSLIISLIEIKSKDCMRSKQVLKDVLIFFILGDLYGSDLKSIPFNSPLSAPINARYILNQR